MTGVEKFEESDARELDTARELIERARELDSQIRALAHHAHIVIEALYALVEEAKAHNIHETLGFPSWTAYIADALDGRWRVERDKRGEVVKFLAEQGMSTRAIAKTIGAGQGTVRRELTQVHPLAHLIIGLDGKSYPRPEPRESDTESDEDFLARLAAEHGRATITIPATVEAARERLEQLAAEQARLERISYEAELAACSALPGWERDAREFGLTLRYHGRLARRAIEGGMSVEEYAETAGVPVAMVEDYLDALSGAVEE